MFEIDLSPIPRQSFSIRLEEDNYDIRIYLCNNIMAIDLVRNNEVLFTGMRLTAGYQIIPYEYLEKGNFVIITANDEYPDYTHFGIDQFLIYLTAAELAALPASI